MNLVVSIVTSISFIRGYEGIEIVIGPKNVLGTTPGNSKWSNYERKNKTMTSQNMKFNVCSFKDSVSDLTFSMFLP